MKRKGKRKSRKGYVKDGDAEAGGDAAPGAVVEGEAPRWSDKEVLDRFIRYFDILLKDIN